jgi:vacuolar-type H+-ATPase subunit F/Vma7
MATKVIAIAQGQSALQIGLTGVPIEEILDPREAEKRLAELLESDSQVVIVEESHREKFSEWFTARLARHTGLPLVIFCPSFAGEEANTAAYINNIVRPAVGFEIRLD